MSHYPYGPEATADAEDSSFGAIDPTPMFVNSPFSTRFTGQDMSMAKKIAARHLPNVAPSTRIELLARSLGYRTAASFQAGFKAIPATPEVVATPLGGADPDGPAAGILSSLPEADREKVAGLGAHVITKILQHRFRIAKSAPNKTRQISASKLFDLGPLAAGTLAARRIMAEARLPQLAQAPLVIQQEDIREAWLASGASAAPPRAEGVAAALLLAIDLGLDADAIAQLKARDVEDARIPLGTRIVASAGQNARGALEAWIGPFARDGAALTPEMLHGADAPTAMASGQACDPDALDALVFAATGSRKVDLGHLSLRDAAVASHLLLCTAFGRSPIGAARRLGVPVRIFRAAVAALGGPAGSGDRDQVLATHLGVSRRTAALMSQKIGAIFEEADSALDVFVEKMDRVDAMHNARAAEPERAPLVSPIERAGEAHGMIELARTDNRASQAHLARYFEARGWPFDFKPSLLSRPRNPVNTMARELIEVAWNEGGASETDSTISVDWLDTHPINQKRTLFLQERNDMRIEVYGDNSACLLVNTRPGSVYIPDLPDDGSELTRRTYGEAIRSRLLTRLPTECLPFPVSVRGVVTTPTGEKVTLGEKGLARIFPCEPPHPKASETDSPWVETPEGRAALARQLTREIEAFHDYALGRHFGLQPETSATSDRTPERFASELPYGEPYAHNQSRSVSGHHLRLRWRLGDDPAHAHLSRDPCPPSERRWAQEALDLAVSATATEMLVEMGDIETALTLPNLATGAPAGVMFLGHPLGGYFAEMGDPTAPARIERAKAALLERLAPVVKKLEKPGFIYDFGREILPVKIAKSTRKPVAGDPKLLDRRLRTHLTRFPKASDPPGFE
jgi:hypothetical protein